MKVIEEILGLNGYDVRSLGKSRQSKKNKRTKPKSSSSSSFPFTP
jgi:hypothetical protein